MDFKEIPKCWAGQKILVIGDIISDYYVKGKATRLCPEAPIPVVKVESTYQVPGGAANLACNILSLGGCPVLVGVVGNDSFGRELLQQLTAQGVEVMAIVDPSRPTTVKTRIMVHQYLIARTDYEDSSSQSWEIQVEMQRTIQKLIPTSDVIVISDYAKGVLTEYLAQEVIQLCRCFDKKCLADPKGVNYYKYQGATAITPNVAEAEIATGITITDEASLCRAGQILLDLIGCESVLITRAEEGVSIFQKNGQIDHIPAKAVKVSDVTGAGDTFMAVLTMALAGGYSFPQAGYLANMAAGFTVQKIGTTTISLDELQGILVEL